MPKTKFLDGQNFHLFFRKIRQTLCILRDFLPHFRNRSVILFLFSTAIERGFGGFFGGFLEIRFKHFKINI
jgi:hypothetical protein